MKLKELYRMLISAENQSFILNYSTRDLKLLGGPLLKEGDEFQTVFGIWENFTVRDGMDTNALVKREANVLRRCIEKLNRKLEQDCDLLQYNYYYAFSDHAYDGKMSFGGAGMSGFQIGDKYGSISAKRPGQIYIELIEESAEGEYEVVSTIDLRDKPKIETTWGEVKVRRRKMGTSLPEKISQLKDFLSKKRGMIEIQHTYNTESAV